MAGCVFCLSTNMGVDTKSNVYILVPISRGMLSQRSGVGGASLRLFVHPSPPPAASKGSPAVFRVEPKQMACSRLGMLAIPKDKHESKHVGCYGRRAGGWFLKRVGEMDWSR